MSKGMPRRGGLDNSRVFFLPSPLGHRPSRLSSMICAKRVFRCFKTIERWGNYITGAAGPFFVGLAVILMTMGTVCFCMYAVCQRRQELIVALS